MHRSTLILLLLVASPARAETDARAPAYVLRLPPGVAGIIIAETDAAELHRFEPGLRGIEHRDTSYMSIGEYGVGKRRAWDRRTPLGIYFVNDRLDTSGMHERYGVMAFPLDYPNAWDLLNERTGDGIWIHGVERNGGRRPVRDTDGCLALPNEELVALEPYLEPLTTPVIITRKIRWTSRESITNLRDDLQAALDAWAQSYRSQDLHRYLSMYARDFRYRGMNREEWGAFRLRTMAARELLDYRIDELMLLADPEDAGLLLSRFRQTIVEVDREVVTMKRLYWRRAEDGELKIVAEDNG